MDVWIEELWQQLESAEWGTEDLLGAVWDLSCLASCNLILGDALDCALQKRFAVELVAITHLPRKRDKRNWDHVIHETTPLGWWSFSN